MSIRPSPIPLANISGLWILVTAHQMPGLKTDPVEQRIEPDRLANALTKFSGDQV